jgi:surface carbohydrate biosynthesis protein
MTAQNPILYLPVENRHREFDAKLLVACAAAERGALAVIGAQTLLVRNAHRMPRGLYLFKGMNRIQREFMVHAASHGHAIAANDEEATGVGDAAYLATYVDDGVPQTCDLALAQGPAHRDMLTNICGFSPGQVVIAGNPRVDLLRMPLRQLFQDEATALRDQLGPFILVNSNAANINPASGSLAAFFDLCCQAGWTDPARPESIRLFLEQVQYDRQNEDLIAAFIRRLATMLPDHGIVLRPHPSERSETLVSRFADVERCRVLGGGSHVPWMLAANVVVHTGCTTGVEAALLDRPVITLAPDNVPAVGWFLSNELNLRAADAGAGVELVRQYLAGEEPAATGTADRQRILARHYAINTLRPAYEIMAEAVIERLFDRQALSEQVSWRPVSINPHQQRTERDRERMTLTESDVTGRVADFQRLLGRFGDLVVRPMWESLFMIHAPGRLRVVR